MNLSQVKMPLSVSGSALACSAAWGGVGALFAQHVAAGNTARFIGFDAVILTLATINRFDKAAVPVARIAFSTWWADHLRADMIALGMIIGLGFGAIAGIYLIAWAVGSARQYRVFPQSTGIFLHRVGQCYLAASALLLALACWYVFALTGYLNGIGKISAAVLSATISGIGSIVIYAFFAWVGFWCTIVGRQLSKSLGLTREL